MRFRHHSAHLVTNALVLASLFAAHAAEPGCISDEIAAKYARHLNLEGVGKARLKRVIVKRDIEFVRRNDRSLLLDFYSATNPPKDQACIVVITGGGFNAQTKSKFAPYAAYLATRGFATASISYRGRPNHTYKATIADTKAAVRFLRTHAAQFGIHPDRFGAMGQSAGGHLAAMLAVSNDVAAFEENNAHKNVSSRIQAAACFAGVFDFISRLRDGGHQTNGLQTKRKTNGEWIGVKFSPRNAKWTEASPIAYVNKNDPPLLLVHCRSDKTVPVAQSEQMYEVIRKTAPQSRLLIFDEGGGHGITKASDVNQQAWDATVEFFNQTLRP